MTPWIRGRKQIEAKLGLDDWKTVKKYIAEGAPITKILGSWLTLDSLLDAWLADRLTSGSREDAEEDSEEGSKDSEEDD